MLVSALAACDALTSVPSPSASAASPSPTAAAECGRDEIAASRLDGTIVDPDGNPLPGQTVTFKATSGSVTPARGRTGADGRISVRWTLGPKSKRPQLAGTVAGTRVSRTLTLSARP